MRFDVVVPGTNVDPASTFASDVSCPLNERRILQVLRELLHVHHRDDLHRRLATVVRVQAVRGAHLSVGRALLRRHENDAVRPAASIDGRRRRVLEHRDVVDDGRIEVFDAAVDRNAVNDVERLVCVPLAIERMPRTRTCIGAPGSLLVTPRSPRPRRDPATPSSDRFVGISASFPISPC
jgi:hypothetical protein